ncbi:MAG: homoserine dehydrogenase [Tissierellales bacterium]|nr:homoserine dehydrogenase [Tissierellales bacterium]
MDRIQFNTIRLGVLGMGTVASGLVAIMEMNHEKIVSVLGKEIEIKRVLVKDINKIRKVNLKPEIYTTDSDIVLADPDIHIIVELIGGIKPAYDYIKTALTLKKHVVTANKALIATHGEELESLASQNGVKLMYEASVGGGIPIINTIRENLIVNEFEEINGIINGTTNYILTQMTERGLEFDQAVKEAQNLGFAEIDPSSDVDGDDAAFKLSILSSIAFGQRMDIKDIPKEGITKISSEDIKYAGELGYKIKLLATAQKNNDEIELRVHPSLIPTGHPLTTVKNEFNAVFIKGNVTGEVMLYGKGAGSLPTGSAVMADIIALTQSMGYPLQESKRQSNKKYKISNRGFSQYYIRLEVIDQPGVLGKIANIFGDHGISLASVVQRQKNGNTAPLVFITHEVNRQNIDSALETIKNFEKVTKIASIIMVGHFK